MIKGGYYLKARIIQESEIATAPPHVREVWDWLLKEVNHSERKSNGTSIKRGQTIRTYKDIQEGLHWMVGYRKETYKKWHCEVAIKWLTSRRMITTTKTTRGLVITVCNYDYYQDSKNYEKDSVNDKTTDTINKNDNTLLSNDESLDVETPPEKFTKKGFLDVLEGEFGDKVNPEYYKIAKSFQLLFISNAKDLMKSDKEPAISKSKFKTVYDPIRLMIETDGASVEDVRRVYKYLAYTKNDFWKKNCQSTDKLRKQFDRLLIEASKHEGTN